MGTFFTPAPQPDQATIDAMLDDTYERARRAADGILSDMERVASEVGGDLRETDQRVKTHASLERKFNDEGAAVGPQQFYDTVNDSVRFAMVLPDGAGYRQALDDAIAALAREGYELDGTPKEFWQQGNRYYGTNATFRSPDGLLIEVQFPTELSYQVWVETHDLYDIIRKDIYTPEERVRAYLEMLEANRRLGIIDAIPPGMDGPNTKDNSLAKWIADNPDVWREFTEQLAAQGKTFADVAAEYGVQPEDFVITPKVAAKLEGIDAVLLRDLREGYRGLSGPGSVGSVHQGPPSGVDSVRSPDPDLAVRPGDGGELDGGLAGRISPEGSGPGGSRTDRDGDNERSQPAPERRDDPAGVLRSSTTPGTGLGPDLTTPPGDVYVAPLNDPNHPQWQQRADLFGRLNGLEAQRRQQESAQFAAQAAQELQTSQQWQAWANHYRSLDPNSMQVQQCEQLAQLHYNNHLQLGTQSHAAYNGAYSQNQSQTVQDPQWGWLNSDSGQLVSDPAPSDGRPYNQRGGLRPPLQRHQDDLSRAMPRNPDGTFVRTPDPRAGRWFGLANDGGPSFDPSRGINCLDCMVSFWQTWRGDPRVSAPRTFDGYQGTNPLAITRGEEHGMTRAQTVSGGQWQSFMPSPAQRASLPAAQTQQFADWGYRSVTSQLRSLGHGSAMFIVTEWQGGSSHAWIAINQGGEILYVDPQSGQVSTEAPLYPHTGDPNNGNNPVAIHGIPIDANGNAQPAPGLGQAVQQMEQYLLSQVQQQTQPQPGPGLQQTQQHQTPVHTQSQTQQTPVQQAQQSQAQTQQHAQQGTQATQHAQAQQSNVDSTPQLSADTTQQIGANQTPQLSADTTQQVPLQQAGPDPRVAWQAGPQQSAADPRVAWQQAGPQTAGTHAQGPQTAGTQAQGQQPQGEQPQGPQGTPPQRPSSAAPRPHRPPDPAGVNPGSVPFGYDQFINDPRYSADAVRFERLVGGHLFNDPAVRETARASVQRLRETLTALAAIDPRITAADIEHAFFPDLSDDGGIGQSAGQAGSGVTLDDLLARGNVRELMTAFYNAAYAFRGGSTLGNLALQIIDSGRMDIAANAGLDVDLLRQIAYQLDESPVRQSLKDTFEEFRHRSIFTPGIISMISENGLGELLATVVSHDGRERRDDADMVPLITTPAHYDSVHAPLGEFERAFIERILGHAIDENTPLPWREGFTFFDTDSLWTKFMEARGFPTAAGISMTTARMLTAARMMGMSGPEQEAFLDALMAWMLPCRDHSLAEIYRAASIAGVVRTENLEASDLTPIEMYRQLTGIDLQTLREQVAENGLFPHEARYLAQANAGSFVDLTPDMLNVANHAWAQLSSGSVTDPRLQEWLGRNGIDFTDTAAVAAFAATVSLPHMIAFSVYTGHGYGLINAAITGQADSEEVPFVRRFVERLTPHHGPMPEDPVVRTAVRDKAITLINKFFEGNPVPPSIERIVTGPAGQQFIDASNRARAAENERDWYRAQGNIVEAEAAADRYAQARAEMISSRDAMIAELDVALPAMIAEAKWHADMIVDGMYQLPRIGSETSPALVYRGDYISAAWSPLYGSDSQQPDPLAKLISTTMSLDVAQDFIEDGPSLTDQRVLVVYQLTGHHAADISVFSVFDEEEVLLPPGVQMQRVAEPDLERFVRSQLPAHLQSCQIVIMREG